MVLLMKEEQIKYIQKHLNIDLDRMNKNSGLINNLIFYKKETNLQMRSKNDLIITSYGSKFGVNKEQIRQSIFDILNCTPVNNFEYPENKKFAVCLTHDIDDVYPPCSHTILSSLCHIKNLDFNGLKKQLFWKDKGKESSPYWNFKEIMKLENKYDGKSSFYFLSTDKDIHRFRYNIEELENELGFIADNGCEIGLHGGYYSYNNLEYIQKEKKRLEKVAGKEVIGYRNHYLMFKFPDTWELLAKAGFKYDTTLGYSDMVGFRNGLCFPFKPFNINTNEEINILEIPLIIMDGALFSSLTSSGKAWEDAKILIDTVEKYNGVLTLLWHNSAFNCPFREKTFKFYKRILEYLYERNAWITSGENILKWWENYV